MFQFISSLKGKIFAMLALVAAVLLSIALLQWRVGRNSSELTQSLLDLQKEEQQLNLQFIKATTFLTLLPENASAQPFPSGLQNLLNELESTKSVSGEFSETVTHFEDAVKAYGESGRYAQARTEAQDSLRRLATSLQEQSNQRRTRMTDRETATRSALQSNANLLTTVSLLSLVLVAVGAALLARATAGKLATLIREEAGRVKALREGTADLSLSEVSEGADEVSQLGRLFGETREALSALIASLRERGHHLEDVVQEDLRHFSELSQATEEMGTNARTIAQTALQLSQSATSTAEASRNGRTKLQQAAAELGGAADRVREGVARMESLANKVREVDQVVQIIRSIASQTNLLALNAAIEASRAGDAGKGFAVVAEEVRKLALQTSKSAENVIGLVQGIQDETQEAVRLIQLIETESSTAAAGARSSQEIFEEISEHSAILAQQIHGIAAATEEQRTTVESMGRKISELFKNVDKSLRPQLGELLKTIDSFRTEKRSA